MQNFVKCVIVAGLAGITAGASAERMEVQRYNGFNSPDGADFPQAYGLRLDNLLGSGTGTTTFSFENPTEPTPREGTSSVDIVLFQDTANPATYYLQIVGTIFGNTTNGGGLPQSAPGDIGQYEIDLTYTGTWVNGLFESDQATGTTLGFLTLLNGSASAPAGIELQAKNRGDYAFRFGFDIGGDDRNNGDYIEATGWVDGWTLDANGNRLQRLNSNGAQDLLFTADLASPSTLIPLPHPAAMAGFSVFGLAMARRRRA